MRRRGEVFCQLKDWNLLPHHKCSMHRERQMHKRKFIVGGWKKCSSYKRTYEQNIDLDWLHYIHTTNWWILEKKWERVVEELGIINYYNIIKNRILHTCTYKQWSCQKKMKQDLVSGW